MTEKKTFESVVGLMREVKAICDQIPAFRIPEEIIKGFSKSAALHQVGKSDEGARAGLKLVGHLRGLLAAFIRFSVYPKQMPDGSERKPFFVQQIERLEEDGYETGIIVGLRAKMEELVQAVKAETDGSFELRIAAYTAMTEALRIAEEEQAKFDRKRLNGGHAIQKPAPDTAMAKRMALLDRRKAEADAARAIFR